MICIRVDGNSIIGTGHVMRCLAIAEQLTSLGGQVCFVVASNTMQSLINEKGYSIITLDKPWDDWNSQIEDMKQLIFEYQIDVMLIDSYYLTEDFCKHIGNYTKIVYIDDLLQVAYSVDTIINYNVYGKQIQYDLLYGHCKDIKFYLGPQYVPLRSEFTCTKRNHDGKIRKILITSGGTDNYNAIEQILECLQNVYQDAYEYYVVLGKYHHKKNEIVQLYKFSSHVHVLLDVKNMAEWMRTCDLAISAGGTTIYELCSCGIPTIMYTIADNQMHMAKAFSDDNIIPYIGDFRYESNRCLDRLLDIMDQYSLSQKRLRSTSKKMQEIVDGNGSKRIASLLLSL